MVMARAKYMRDEGDNLGVVAHELWHAERQKQRESAQRAISLLPIAVCDLPTAFLSTAYCPLPTATLIRRCLHAFLGHSTPAGGREAGGLFESAGEMALVREAAISGDFDQILAVGKQIRFGLVDLAFEHELFWSQAEQFRESAMKMEGAEMGLFGDLIELGSAMILLLHELQRRNEAGEFGIGLEILRLERSPIGTRGLAAKEGKWAGPERREFAEGDEPEDPDIAVRIGNLDAVGGRAVAVHLVHAALGAIEQLLAEMTIERGKALGVELRLELAVNDDERNRRFGTRARLPPFFDGWCLISS